MELSKVTETRRSVREYINKPVETEKLREMIAAAQLAPSWKNSQVSRYYVVTGEKLADVKNALSPYNQKNVADAPALIVTAIVLNVPDTKRTVHRQTNSATVGDFTTAVCRV